MSRGGPLTFFPSGDDLDVTGVCNHVRVRRLGCRDSATDWIYSKFVVVANLSQYWVYMHCMGEGVICQLVSYISIHLVMKALAT